MDESPLSDQKEAQPSATAPVRVSFGPYSIEAPNNWTLSSVILSGPPDDGPAQDNPSVRPFQRNMITTMEAVADDVTVEVYARQQRDGLAAAGVGWQLLTEEEVDCNGLEANLAEQLIEGAGGELVQQMQLILVKRNVAFTTIASHLAGPAFEGVRDEFREMLMSFR